MSVIPFIVAVATLIAVVPASHAQDKSGKYIFEYKKELALTDKQEKELRGIIGKLSKYLSDNKKLMDGLKAELDMFIEKKTDIKKIRAKLEEISKVQVDSNCEDILSARAVEGVLTPEQLAKWRTIQQETRKSLRKNVDNNTRK
ncbi:MAG: hypothetical protein WC481_01175 [Candidatus Omnitrophota bacterium]